MKFPFRLFVYLFFAGLLAFAVEWQKGVITERNSAELISVLNEWRNNGWPIETWEITKQPFLDIETVSLLKQNSREAIFVMPIERARNVRVGMKIMNPKTFEVIGEISRIPQRVNSSHGMKEIRVGLSKASSNNKHIFETAWVVKSLNSELIIPIEAISYDKNKAFVWVLDQENNMPIQRKIDIAENNPWAYRVISGVASGDILITNGTANIERRSKVNPLHKAGPADLFLYLKKVESL